ncbi:hypothetical protein CIB48_g6251 [Xylaria polymorpha]|nr:hypothetical protein CIB48_g6251 [Xylaria polymorpha]
MQIPRSAGCQGRHMQTSDLALHCLGIESPVLSAEAPSEQSSLTTPGSTAYLGSRVLQEAGRLFWTVVSPNKNIICMCCNETTSKGDGGGNGDNPPPPILQPVDEPALLQS